MREIAVKAFVDPRTLVKYLAGDPIRPMCSDRIARVLRQMGIAPEQQQAKEGAR